MSEKFNEVGKNSIHPFKFEQLNIESVYQLFQDCKRSITDKLYDVEAKLREEAEERRRGNKRVYDNNRINDELVDTTIGKMLDCVSQEDAQLLYNMTLGTRFREGDKEILPILKESGSEKWQFFGA